MTRIEKKDNTYTLWVSRETMWAPILVSSDKRQIDYMKYLYEKD